MKRSTMANDSSTCELCNPDEVVFENALAYVRHDSNSLSRGHVLVVPKRHVADFFEMTTEEQSAVLALLNQAHESSDAQHSPDGYNHWRKHRQSRRSIANACTRPSDSPVFR